MRNFTTMASDILRCMTNASLFAWARAPGNWHRAMPVFAKISDNAFYTLCGPSLLSRVLTIHCEAIYKRIIYLEREKEQVSAGMETLQPSVTCTHHIAAKQAAPTLKHITDLGQLPLYFQSHVCIPNICETISGAFLCNKAFFQILNRFLGCSIKR